MHWITVKTKYDVNLYPSTQVMEGSIAPDEYVEKVALAIYDELICDRRINIEDVPKLLDIAIELRQNKRGDKL